MELTKGIFNVLRTKVDESVLLAIIFFVGHVLIAVCVVYVITGATIWEAGAVALVEPAINSIWFIILHKAWKTYYAN